MKRWSVYSLIHLTVCMSIAVIAIGCGSGHAPAASEQQVATGTAGLLFTVDGVRVYRFADDGHYHYFAVPRNGTFASAMTDWTETHCNPCGKSTCCYTVARHEDVPTIGQ